MLNYVEIELDRPRKIRFSIPDLRDLQRRLNGLSLVQIVRRLQDLDLDVLVPALWAGLRREDPKLRPDDVEQLIQAHIDGGGNLGQIIGPLSDAFVAGAGLERKSAEDGEGKARGGKAAG